MKNKMIFNKKNYFYKKIDKLFLEIEDNLNLYINKFDIDYDIQDYVITITFPNNSVIIINKQEPLYQIWLATKTNAYHFNYKDNQWICNRSKKNFWEILEHSFFVQLGKHLTFYNSLKNKTIKKN